MDDYDAFVRGWNKFVPRYNAVVNPRAPGRPLAASDKQCAEVLRLRKDCLSLRAIAKHTNLGLQTVRNIVGKRDGTDRTAKRDAKLRKRELNRANMAAWRPCKRTRDALPRRIQTTLEKGRELLKAAKGTGKRS